jgi:tRNA nucleotidyltransferase (CCA-adding enzyme)
MSTLPIHFRLLLNTIEPEQHHKDLAAQLPGEVRAWLKDHEYPTKDPHTRLIGSYQRSTVVGDIKDIDMLVFLPTDALDRTPGSVLRELREVLDDYPDASAEASPQRRSIHLAFPKEDVHLDIVPAVAKDGLENALEIPDRLQQKWLLSDPLGYNRELSSLNQNNQEKVVP